MSRPRAVARGPERGLTMPKACELGFCLCLPATRSHCSLNPIPPPTLRSALRAWKLEVVRAKSPRLGSPGGVVVPKANAPPSFRLPELSRAPCRPVRPHRRPAAQVPVAHFRDAAR